MRVAPSPSFGPLDSIVGLIASTHRQVTIQENASGLAVQDTGSMGSVRSELDMGNFPGLIIWQPDLRHLGTVVHIDVPAADSTSGHRIKGEFLGDGIEFAERVLVGQAEPDHVILVDDWLVRIRVPVISRQLIFSNLFGVNIDLRQAASEKF